MNSIIRKELRDLSKWIPLCMIAVGVLCWLAVQQPWRGQVLEGSLVSMGGAGCALTALLFGFLQSIFDSRNDASGFLLHRPVSALKIFWGKLFAGAIAYAISIGVPLIGIATYLEVMGPEQMPTSGRQALRLAVFSIVVFSFHPTAMWIVCGRFRSRLLLFLVPIFGIAIAATTLQQPTTHLLWFALSVLLTPLLCAWGARHAFCNIQFSPAANDHRANSWLEIVSFVAICVTLFSVAVGWIGSQLSYGVVSYSGLPKVAVTDDGEIWELQERWNSQEATYTGRKISAEDNQFATLPQDFKEAPAIAFSNYQEWMYQRAWDPEFAYTNFYGETYVFNHKGRLYVYKLTGPRYEMALVSIVTPQGFFSPRDTPSGRFANLRTASYASPARNMNGMANLSYTGALLQYDETGVYQINGANRTVTKLVDEPIDQVSAVLPMDGRDGSLWTLSGTKVKKYALQSSDGEPLDPLPTGPSPANFIAAYAMPMVSAKLEQEWDVEPFSTERKYETLSIYETNNSVVTTRHSLLTSNDWNVDYKVRELDGELRKSDSFELANVTVSSLPSTPTQAVLPFPPLLLAALAFVPNMGSATPLFLFTQVLHGLVAAALTLWFASWLGLSSRPSLCWAIAAGLLGLGVPLALWCVRPRTLKEPCPKCESLRSIERMQCEKCGAAWDRPAPDGTEIIGLKLGSVEFAA